MIDELCLHVKHALCIWRALGLPVTPKVHCIEDHLVDIVRYFGGVGDIGEDEGERAHQTGHKEKARTGALRDPNKKALSRAQTEYMRMNEEVREYQAVVSQMITRKRKRGVESKGDATARVAKLTRDQKRRELLSLPFITSTIVLLDQLRVMALQQMELLPNN
jgi:hypothetical protein